MTTARSPLRVLKAQADRIAKMLKAIERGEDGRADVGGKIAAARAKASVSFAVAMDDKVVKVELSWTAIHTASESQIAKFILEQMTEGKK
jgi:hypothetical protein